MSNPRRRKASKPEAAAQTRSLPRWLLPAVLALTAICLLGLFSTEIADTDFWWHLETGQYILEHRALPVPDPFAYTTAMNPPADAHEAAVRHFNLTHEWLSQVAMYLVYAAGGFPSIVLVRALLLAILCGLSGVLAARLGGSFWLGVAAAFATASVAIEFRADRPGIVTFLCVAVFIVVLEHRRGLWWLPLVSLLWANSHGGFILGWLVLAAYCAEIHVEDRRRIWLVSLCCVAASFINPNGYGVISAYLGYRRSPMTANLIEWQPPSLWGSPYGYDLLLFAALLVLIASWKKVRVAHWILFAAFAAASLMAFRNILLIGFLAPALIAGYLRMRAKTPALLTGAAALMAGVLSGPFFQFGVAEWTVPASATDFIAENHIAGHLFNTYEQGGYLIWRLWPQQRVFMDGRSLSEAAYRDYQTILFNKGAAADQIVGARAERLQHYGVEVVAMNTIDYVSGAIYPLALALANPATTDWQLVHDDAQEVIFLRQPPPGMPVFQNKLGHVIQHLNAECEAYIAHSPDTPLCARTLAEYWLRLQQKDLARRMLELYVSHAPRDEQAQRALRQLQNR